MTRSLRVEACFDAPIVSAFDAYWRLENWSQVLDDVVSVAIEYDDGEHQAFSMTVEGPNGWETVRGVRFAPSPNRLELCQFAPPPGFRFMQGVWSFEAIDAERTLVRAERSFALDDSSAEAACETKIAFMLNRNLAAFKVFVERRGDA